MTQGDAVDRLLAAFPQTDAWPRLAGEAYGPGHLRRARRVSRVLYAVTCTPEVEDACVQGRYQLLVLHHPMRPLRPLPHVVLHTPLDCGVGGLNDLWRDALGIQNARHIVDNLGWYGPCPMTMAELRRKVHHYVGGFVGQLHSTRYDVSSIAVCTGLGGWIAREAFETGADAFITGELTQPASRIGCPVVIEVGHTRSEQVGARAIRRVLGPGIQVDLPPYGADRFANEIYLPAQRGVCHDLRS